MSSRKISGKWQSAGTRLKRLRRTVGAGGIVSNNASLTRDEPGTRNNLQKKTIAILTSYQGYK